MAEYRLDSVPEVREGLQKLRAHGLIESRKGLGAFVTTPPASDPLTDFARWTASDPAASEDAPRPPLVFGPYSDQRLGKPGIMQPR